MALLWKRLRLLNPVYQLLNPPEGLVQSACLNVDGGCKFTGLPFGRLLRLSHFALHLLERVAR